MAVKHSFVSTVPDGADTTVMRPSDINADHVIDDNTFANAKLAQMATKTYKGRTSSGTGNAEDVSVANLKTDLSLDNVDNTSDANKPVSTAQQTALDLKSNLASPTFTGTVTTPAIVVSSETASTIASLDASKNIKSLAVATYPSLTELTYVKGVTSAIQTQINGKQASMGADDNYVTDAEKVVIGNTSGTNTGDSSTPAETATTIGALIGGAVDATPNDTDFVATSLTAGGILKKITWTNVKAFLKTYTDTLYNLYVHPNHSGDVTSVADGATTIAQSAVSYSKIQNVSATDKVLGRISAGAGVVEEITCTSAGRALLDDADAATQRSTLGLGTIATQASNSVAITGGSVTGITDLAVADGGTGTSTGSITGTESLTFTAGGTNQNITLSPSGTGYTLLNGNVGIGTSTPLGLLHVDGLNKRMIISNGDGFDFFYAGQGLYVRVIGTDGTPTDNVVVFQKSSATAHSYTAWYSTNVETMRFTGGNVGIGITGFGTSAAKCFGMGGSTAPTTSPADMFQLYVADIVAGNAAPHFRTENGGIVKLYKYVDARIDDTPNSGDATTDGIIASIQAALQANGLMAAA